MSLKIFMLVFIILFGSLLVVFAQEQEDVEIEYVYDESSEMSYTSFDSSLPENGVNSASLPVVATEEEFIFKTFIMENLLKSNRILY